MEEMTTVTEVIAHLRKEGYLEEIATLQMRPLYTPYPAPSTASKAYW
jgi:hypothetical protein